MGELESGGLLADTSKVALGYRRSRDEDGAEEAVWRVLQAPAA